MRFVYPPTNLQRAIEHLLTRPVGRPSKAPKVFYESFTYQAKSWGQARRVVAKVEWHQGELFPRVGFIVTNLSRSAKGVVKFYNGRGTAEQWIKEGKNAVKWTRLSCHDFVDNQVRLQLFALAYNQANFLRRLALPQSVKHWSLTTLREKLVKTGPNPWGQGRDPRTVCHISDGRGGYSETTVQDHPSPDFTTRPTVTCADMTMATFAGMETVQDLMGRSAQIRTNSTDGGLRWLLLGREGPQGAIMTAKSVLNSSVCLYNGE